MKARLILVSLGLAVLGLFCLGIQAQEGTKANKDDLIASEQQLANLFADFQTQLFRLKTRLERGSPEERKRAEDLAKVLDECKNLAVNQEFTRMLEILRLMKVNNTNDLDNALKQSQNIGDRLSKILRMIQDSKSSRLSEERKALENFIEEIRKAIEKQQIAEGLTKLGKTDKDELGKIQNNVTKETEKIDKGIEKFLNKDKDGKGGEQLPTKGDVKPGDKADGGKSGESKNDGSKPSEKNKGESKADGGKDSQKGPKGETKPGDKQGNPADPKEPKNGDAPQSGAKSGEKSGKDSPQAGAKGEPKSGQKGQEGASKGNPDDKGQKKGQEGGAKDSGKKDGDPKSDKDSPQGSAKGSEKSPSSGSPKDQQGKPDSSAKPSGGGGDPMSGGAKPEASKAGGDPKAGGDSKSGGDAKAGEPGSAAGDSKAGDSKDGQGQAKDGGAAGGMGGMGGDSPQADNKGGGSPPPGGTPPPPPGGPQDNIKNSQKRVKEAGYDQKAAEDEIKKDQKAQAAKNQADAIQKLQDAQKQLEKLLRQIREEELERVLAALQARCEKMLILQKQVLVGTIDTDVAIKKNDDKKPNRNNQVDALKLADKEKEIIQEANKCIDILEAEGSAVAFPEVFQQIRQDMMHVQKRLELTDTADITQGIEKDIIATLEEMIKALKEARDNNQDSAKSPPGKGGPGKQGDQTLLKLIQELKMVRSLQDRVNKRTDTISRVFQGEQAGDPQSVRELRNLAERQRRIQEIVDKIAKGDNK